jgi:anti-anti-sigma regulatory factor
VLRLEGRIVGPWVDELRRSSAVHAGRPGELVLDLARVSFLDASGVALIRDLAGRGVRVVNSSPFVAEQLRTA